MPLLRLYLDGTCSLLQVPARLPCKRAGVQGGGVLDAQLPGCSVQAPEHHTLPARTPDQAADDEIVSAGSLWDCTSGL